MLLRNVLGAHLQGFFPLGVSVRQDQIGPKSAPFPCENANLTNGTSFVFLGNLKHDFSVKWMFLARLGLKCLVLQLFFGPKWAKLCTASLRQRPSW